MRSIILVFFIAGLYYVEGQTFTLPSACQAVLQEGLGWGVCFPGAICKDFKTLPQGNCTDNSCCFITGLEPFKCGNKGKKPTNIKPRIIGGRLTGSNEFCWQAAIADIDGNFIGGGSLIRPQWILTAAHLVTDIALERLVVQLGTADLSAPDSCSQTLNVTEIIIHNQYNSTSNYVYNIALLKLGSLADITTECACLACLPDFNDRFEGRVCEASGYGTTFGPGKETSNLLHSATLLVKNNKVCQDNLRQRLQDFEMHSTFICAGGDDDRQDTCTGDGGSPLVCPDVGGRYVQAGIVAWGLGCGEIGLPSIYTNVVELLPWILNKIQMTLPNKNASTNPTAILPIFPGLPSSLKPSDFTRLPQLETSTLTSKLIEPILSTLYPSKTIFQDSGTFNSPKRPIIFNSNVRREGLEGRSENDLEEY